MSDADSGDREVTTEDVVRIIRDSDSNRLTTREVASALDVRRRRARNLLEDLEAEGRVKRVAHEAPESPMWRMLE